MKKVVEHCRNYISRLFLYTLLLVIHCIVLHASGSEMEYEAEFLFKSLVFPHLLSDIHASWNCGIMCNYGYIQAAQAPHASPDLTFCIGLNLHLLHLYLDFLCVWFGFHLANG